MAQDPFDELSKEDQDLLLDALDGFSKQDMIEMYIGIMTKEQLEEQIKYYREHSEEY